MIPTEESRLEVENRYAVLQMQSLPSVVAHAPAIPAQETEAGDYEFEANIEKACLEKK